MLHEDGRREVLLDVATLHELDSRTMSQREQALIEENARLRDDLAHAKGIVRLHQEETPLPETATPLASVIAGTPVLDLSNPAAEQEEAIIFAQPKMLSQNKLRAMRKVDLASHARSFDPEMSPLEQLMAGKTKEELVQLCLELQRRKAYSTSAVVAEVKA